jgi:hypothetical protein
MSTRKIRCTDCGEAVPYGRLSCPSCGTLLASVAGGVRSVPAADVVVAPVRPSEEPTGTASSVPMPTLMPRPHTPTLSAVATGRTGAASTLVPATVVRSMPAGAFVPSTGGAAVATWPGTAPSAPAQDARDDAPAVPTPGFAARWDIARLGEGLDWAAAIGSGFVAIGMLLPWSASVIGSGQVSGYFDTWGIAGPAHVLVLVWALVVLGLSLVPNPVPAWIRTGLAGLTLGVFALGLVWPYLIGPLGGQVGVIAMTIGAFVLIPTGVIADWHSRHGSEDPAV